MKTAEALVPPTLNAKARAPHPMLQRKCTCGKPIVAGRECADCRRKRQATAGLQLQPKLVVNQPGDRFEQEADRMADFVVSGSASRGPAALSPVSGRAIQREDKPAPPKPNNYEDAVKKILNALAETPVAKELKAKAAAMGKDFLGSVEGKVIAGSALGGALAAIIASNSELPMQIPELPLDFIAPGLKAKLTWEGPVQKPTSVGLTLTSGSGVKFSASYSSTPASGGKPAEDKGGLSITIPLGGSSKKPGGLTDSEKFRAETARIAAEQAKFREGMKGDKDRADDKAFLDSYVRSKIDNPLNPLGAKKKEDLLMRKEAGADSSSASTAPPIVNEVLSESGQPLEPATREFMEPRFGHDFSHVRVHTDEKASQSARAVNALAYTVGSNLVFAQGEYAPNSATGRKLLAHELTHAIQQSGPGATEGHMGVARQKKPDPLAPSVIYDRADFGQRFTAEVNSRAHRATLLMGVDFIPTGWSPHEKPEEKLPAFKSRLKQVIESSWSGVYALQSVCHGAADKFEARVNIVLDAPNQHATIMFHPNTPGGRSGASDDDSGGGRGAALQEGDVNAREHKRFFETKKGKPPEERSFMQITAAHEFGHLLGLSHPHCKGNDSQCYGVTTEEAMDVMGVGSVVSKKDYAPFVQIMERYGRDTLPAECNKWKLVEPG